MASCMSGIRWRGTVTSPMKKPLPLCFTELGAFEPPVPQGSARLVVLGHTDLGGMLAQYLLHDRLVAGDFGRGAIDVDEHDRVGVERVAGVVELLQPGDALSVEPFHRGGDDTGGDDRGDGIGGGPGSGERTHQAVGDFGDRAERDGGLGDDPQRAFGSDEDTEQVRSVVVCTEGDGGPVGEHDFRGEDVVVGDAVLQGVRAACVLDDVARHGGQVRRHRVRREAQAVRCEPLLQVGIDDAGFDAGAPVVDVDLEDPIQAGKIQQHPVGGRHHPRRAVRRPTAGHHRNAVFGCDPHDFGDLAGGAGAQQQPGGSAEAPEVVATICQDRVVGDDFRATATAFVNNSTSESSKAVMFSCCGSGHFDQILS